MAGTQSHAQDPRSVADTGAVSSLEQPASDNIIAKNTIVVFIDNASVVNRYSSVYKSQIAPVMQHPTNYNISSKLNVVVINVADS